MNILNVNNMLDLRTGGGTAERTLQMSMALSRCGNSCRVLTLGVDEVEIPAQLTELGIEVVSVPLLSKRFYIPKNGLRLIYSSVKWANVIHLMGHWGILNALVCIFAIILKKPYVVCPAGALSLYGRSILLKKIYNFVIGKRIIRYAAACIAVTNLERHDFESYGVDHAKVAVIPNGINISDFPEVEPKSFYERFQIPERPYVLFMGRLNPIKGPDILLNAFREIHKSFPELQLVYAGPDGGMLEDLKSNVQKFNLAQFVFFVGHIDGLDKVAAYRGAQLLVVPSRNEAMSIVALEAGVCATLAVLTKKCGFDEIVTISPMLEVECLESELAAGIKKLLSNPELINSLSQKYQEFVVKKYSWNYLADIYMTLYKRLVPRLEKSY